MRWEDWDQGAESADAGRVHRQTELHRDLRPESSPSFKVSRTPGYLMQIEEEGVNEYRGLIRRCAKECAVVPVSLHSC